MKISSAIAIMITSVAITACASNISSEAPVMKDAKMMKDSMMKKDSTMMKGESCHNHSANSMTKSSSHCHQSSQADHSHKYGG